MKRSNKIKVVDGDWKLSTGGYAGNINLSLLGVRSRRLVLKLNCQIDVS